jgi:hypothetical protein
MEFVKIPRGSFMMGRMPMALGALAQDGRVEIIWFARG